MSVLAQAMFAAYQVGGGGGDPSFSNVLLNAHFDVGPPVDNSPSPKTITLNGSAAISTGTKKFGAGSLYADDITTNYASVAADASFAMAGQFTIEFWVYGTFASQCNVIAQASSGFVVFITSARSVRLSFGGATIVTTLESFLSNTWTHIAVCRDAANLVTVYIQGVKSGNTATASGTCGANAEIRIGNNGGSNNTLKYMDDVRISTVARYSANFTPPTAAFPDS